jgi:cytochrome c
VAQKIYRRLIVLGACLFWQAPAWPQTVDGLALAKAKACLGCHQVDSKRVGPSFIQIAQRHGTSQAAIEYLASSIKQGGRGRWGAVPMPSQPVSELEALELARWMTALKPPESP